MSKENEKMDTFHLSNFEEKNTLITFKLFSDGNVLHKLAKLEKTESVGKFYFTLKILKIRDHK